jgi:hypothetical protein
MRWRPGFPDPQVSPPIASNPAKVSNAPRFAAPARLLPIGMPERLRQRLDATTEPITIRLGHSPTLRNFYISMHYNVNLIHYKSL